MAGWITGLIALTAACGMHIASTQLTSAAEANNRRPPRMMVALVFGQSNAANFGETRHTAGPNVHVLHKGRLYRARDPLRGANGEGGSVWTRLGDKLIAEGLFDTVIFVPAAVGGTEIARWTPDGDLFPLVERAIEDVHRRKLKFTHLLWHQGESDAMLRTHPGEYQRLFRAMLAGIRSRGVDAPIFVAAATRCGQYPVNEDIHWAQRNLVSPSVGILAGPDTDLLDETFRYDGCHFSKQGLEAHAQMWLEHIKAHLPADWMPTPAPPAPKP
ncbi:MAG: sialate O-acetylesterase [Anaerolineae bacterium]|nr:sialate O-acetylesterase [Thermoflexales bacterium]MDW8406415.1 sialate O-acetylesterase [Anaerolineae bacterium]